MEDAVQGLELQFQQADQELQFIACRLEQEFMEHAGKDPHSINPAQFIARIQKLREDIPLINSKIQSVVGGKQQLLDACSQSLGPTFTSLLQLAKRSGMPEQLSSEAAQHFEETVSAWTTQVAH
eukprot:TRINITY_DN14076_c0_g1_i1.p1 TRINITY_DN14076_c0_g1~~TRINITY_DN14076_c0_g1_i1.p1  ORF type:complete len:132 (-),score=34.70 TRINITY_DN14076_c0_g1_i1:30-401(-)